MQGESRFTLLFIDSCWALLQDLQELNKYDIRCALSISRMTTPTRPNPISLGNIQTEFGGVAPAKISEYYRGGAYVDITLPDNGFGSGPVATSGTIKFSQFWNQADAAAPGAISYLTPGTYSFVVPNGWTTLTTIVIGAGGGGGGAILSGDIHGGSGGGSGGVRYMQNISVTPGETLTVTVGAGGLKGLVNNNPLTPNTGNQMGGQGGTSQIARGGTVLLSCTGGGGGIGNAGDNWSPAVGTAGVPNGVPGDQSWAQRNVFESALGGNNGTNYGTGGRGNSTNGVAHTDGGAGYVWIAWGSVAATPPIPYSVRPSGTAQFAINNAMALTFIVTPSLTFKAAGYTTWTATQNSDGAKQWHSTPPWLRPTVAGYNGNQYWLRATITENSGGGAIYGSFGIWLPMTSDRTFAKDGWYWVETTDPETGFPNGTTQVPAVGILRMTIEISTTSNGSNIIASYPNTYIYCSVSG